MQTLGKFFIAVQCIKGIKIEFSVIAIACESESFMSEADAVLAHEDTKANADSGQLFHCCTMHQGHQN